MVDGRLGARGGSRSHSQISQKPHIPCRYGGDREASVAHIKTAGVTDRVPLLEASEACTEHKPGHCIKGRHRGWPNSNLNPNVPLMFFALILQHAPEAMQADDCVDNIC